MNARFIRNGFIWLLIIVAVVVIITTVLQPSYGNKEVPVSTVIDWAKQGRVASIEVRRDDLTVTTKEGQTFRSRKEEGFSLLETLTREGVATGEGGVKVTVKSGGGLGSFFTVALNFLPLLLFALFLLFMLRQAQGSSSQTLTFGRSRARLFMANRPTVTFADVAGVDEAKQELQEVVEFLKYPERFASLGARIPRGVLLVGPPGTGKTLLARAVAGEAGVPFFSISGSEFVEMFVGVGAARVRDLFDQAKRNAPCIVFIDEIDAVGRHRGAGLGGGHDEREQTLNQILVEMDGFDTSTNIIVIAATNRPDILDPALLRPGRFDRRVVLDLPDVQGRLAILKVHTRGKPLESDVSLDLIARQTAGFSGADLANLVNEAAILAARRNKKTIGVREFAEAIDRVVAGPERKSRVISPKEKEITAYHEAGHALVARMLPHADPVHKISIVARGMMGGYTRMIPQEDRHLWTRNQFEAMLAVALGGRVAEELVFGEVTTGASNDLEQATRVARAMVTRYGMSDKLGPRVYGKREELIFLGKEIAEQRDYSPRTEELIDEEVNTLLRQAKERAETILRTHRAKLDQVARYLMQYETVEGEDLERLFNAPPDAEVKPSGLIAPTPEAPKVPAPSAGPLPAPAKPKPASEGPAPAPAG
ncbi:MAG: ATP-dependent zinc metalloprotease FtsH [Dehalococcoidia bacterium]|nr:ATP-dependent zinc metalloprotease FtsH [Dehalococcoidia bacterium]MDW8120290.1 ATP-dependent zinc metalloprotease FtsH [Chloroflexota bacterium]